MNYGEEPEEIRAFIDKGGFNFHVLRDDREEGVTGPLYQVGGIPTLFLIDRGNVVRWKKVGFSPGDEDSIRARVEVMIGKESA